MMYSVPDLKARGWTATAIKNFLPRIPDDSCPNPKYSNAGAPMKFWFKARVHRREKTKRFLAWAAGTENRRKAAYIGVATKSQRMADNAVTAEITIVRGLSDDEIHKRAVETHGGNYRGDPGEFHWSKTTARNCIRHNFTNYERLWAITNRGDTGTPAYLILRERVDTLIEENYPQFAGPDWPRGADY